MMVQRENIKEHNSNQPEIPCHTYRILIIGGSGYGKTNSLFDLICHQPNIHKIYLNAKDVFENMIADKFSNKALNPILSELFISARKLNISLVFIKQSYFAVPKNIRLNSTHYVIIKISNKGELREIVLNHSSDIELKEFMNLYKKCTTKPYFFQLLTLFLHQIILHVSERIFYEEYKN